METDETYIGGKREHIPGIRDTDWKVPVVTLVERDGEARSVIMPTVNAKNLKDHLTGNIAADAHLMTDQSPSYNQAGKRFASHDTVDHTREEWVRGEAHVNTAEGFFSQFKRSLDETRHHVRAPRTCTATRLSSTFGLTAVKTRTASGQSRQFGRARASG